MRTTYTVNFYCRSSKANRNGESPVELSIIINGKRCFIQLPIKCKSTEFKKLITSRKSNPIKDYCEEARYKLQDIQLDMYRLNIPFNVENIRKYYQNGGVTEEKYTVENLFTDYINLIKNRVGNDLTFAAYRRYYLASNVFYKAVDRNTEVKQLNPAIMQEFLFYLNQHYQESTVNGIMTKIKTMVKLGMDNGKIEKNPFQGIKYGKGKKDIEYLEESEIETLKNKEISIERLTRVRDLAIFQINSGLSYADMCNLSKEDIKFTDEGTCYISKKRQKTKVEYTAVVLSDGVDILKKYDYQLPIISNQKLNGYLKEIQTICGIDKSLHSHIFRKTYGTLLLNKGVRLEVVSRCLGHSSTQITQSVYSKMLKETVINEVKAAF